MSLLYAWWSAVLVLAVSEAVWSVDQPLPRGVTLREGDTFEYIVVGAGAAGAALAARLAARGAATLLVEAGEDPSLLAKIPAAANGLFGTSLDWQYDTISNNISCLSYRNNQCRFSRGKCLGGSTTINHMMYVRGNPHDFDSFNITGWAWEDVRPYFIRYEGLQDLALLPDSSIPYHNTNGTMRMEFFADPENPWHSRITEGFNLLNFPLNPDVNAESQIGVSQVVGYVYNGERMTTARAYLTRGDVKENLKVAKDTRCTGVIIDDGNVARGITVVSGLFKRRLKIYATREVVLSAGAIATPPLLLLSGIGPADHLKEMNIPVRVELPVGEGMTDHLLPLLFVKVDEESRVVKKLLSTAFKTASSLAQLLLFQDGPLTSNGLTDMTAFANTLCYDYEKHKLTNDSAECQLPTLQVIHVYVDRYLLSIGRPFFQHVSDLNDNVSNQLADINEQHPFIIISPIVLQSKSQGYVRLASSDPLDEPAIFPNYLSDERDVEEMIRSIRIIEDLADTPPFKKHNASIVRLKLEGCPEYEGDGRRYWECYTRHMTQTTYHSVGTTALGRVVDERLRVRGVQRLRVADAGVLPQLVRGNIAAACIAIGERAADFLWEDRDNTTG